MINWWRVIANGGVQACTSFLTASALGFSEGKSFELAAALAIVQGFLAFFLEIKKETDENGGYEPTLSSMLVLV